MIVLPVGKIRLDEASAFEASPLTNGINKPPWTIRFHAVGRRRHSNGCVSVHLWLNQTTTARRESSNLWGRRLVKLYTVAKFG
jgi:hypothetical protein